MHILVGNELLGIDVVQVPLEAGAVESLAQRDALGDVAMIGALELATMHVVQPLVVVHPDLGETHAIVAVDVQFAFLARHVVRMTRPEDMTHVTAWNELQRASAHPSL